MGKRKLAQKTEETQSPKNVPSKRKRKIVAQKVRQHLNSCKSDTLDAEGTETAPTTIVSTAGTIAKVVHAEGVEAKVVGTSHTEGGSSGEEEDVGEEPQAKKPWKSRERKADPFAIPPSGCDATVFGIQQPFIDVVFSMDVKEVEGDKVMDKSSMNVEALKAAIDVMSREYLLASMTSRAPASELAYRDLHVALIKSFWWLTKPRTSQPVKYSELLALRDCEVEKKPRMLEEITELNIEVDARNLSEPMNRSSVDSLDVRLEGDKGGEKPTKSARYDIKCQVYDENIVGMDKTVVVLLVECKWNSLSVDDIYQVAAYACESAKKNFQKGITSPLQLEVWSDLGWRYAVLFPAGLVKVEAQSIVEVKGSNRTKEALMARMNLIKMNDKYPGVEWPDGDYLHGVLYISNEKFALPAFGTRGSLVSGDSLLFYESKLRILVGEKVLKWTTEDVRRAKKVREDAFMSKHAMLMNG